MKTQRWAGIPLVHTARAIWTRCQFRQNTSVTSIRHCSAYEIENSKIDAYKFSGMRSNAKNVSNLLCEYRPYNCGTNVLPRSLLCEMLSRPYNCDTDVLGEIVTLWVGLTTCGSNLLLITCMHDKSVVSRFRFPSTNTKADRVEERNRFALSSAVDATRCWNCLQTMVTVKKTHDLELKPWKITHSDRDVRYTANLTE